MEEMRKRKGKLVNIVGTREFIYSIYAIARHTHNTKAIGKAKGRMFVDWYARFVTKKGKIDI